jgi:hypothetical protein
MKFRLLIILILILNKACLMWGYDFFELPEETPGYVGSVTCMTSMCHGGADTLHRQYTIWRKLDPHSKSYPTLTTAWSKRMGESLGIDNPAQDPRCLSCHAPMAMVEKSRRSPAVTETEGVTCESCHGPASAWVLSHTRPDYTYEQRVAAGMRDLKNLYNRAANCVACHQTLDPDIRAAGHPELKFDFVALQDRQPRHWIESSGRVQQWMVGQATSLRELAYVISLWKEDHDTATLEEEAMARRYLLETICADLRQEPGMAALAVDFPENDWATLSRTADRAVRDLSHLPWSQQMEAVVRTRRQQILGAGGLPLPDEVSGRVRSQLTAFPTEVRE